MAKHTTDLLMPRLGLTMTEGLLVEWRVGIGDEVQSGDVLFVIESDKVANEIESPGAGVIEAILVTEGETVPTGTPLARWTGPGLPDTDTNAADSGPPRPAPEPAHGRDSPAVAAPGTGGGQRIVATPQARRLARRSGVDLTQVPGSGPGGRIKAGDVERAGATATPATPARKDRLVDPGSIRTAMAQRMSAAVRDVPHFYLAAEVVADPLLALRQEMNKELAPLRLTVGHFVVAAVARALATVPDDNRIWDNGRYRVLASVDVGIAVAVAAGLLAPVLRGAGGMRLVELAAAHDRLVSRARSGELDVDDMKGGAVTVSNLGAQGVSQVFPIINPPQSLILGVGTARAVLTESVSGDTERQTLLSLVLGADHRVFDGMNGAVLLARISEGLQEPRILLEG